jgi:hypothetical protein
MARDRIRSIAPFTLLALMAVSLLSAGVVVFTEMVLRGTWR